MIDYLQHYYDTASAAHLGVNLKAVLQRYAQNSHGVAPTYTLISEHGPDHMKEFIVEVRIPRSRLNARGRGRTKKVAEKAAAEALLSTLDPRHRPNLRAKPLQVARVPRVPAGSEWSFGVWMKGVSKLATKHPRVEQFACALRDATGICLPLELAEIVLVHAGPGMRQNPGLFGGKENGLTALGNAVYRFAIAREVIRRRKPQELARSEAPGTISAFLSALDSNRYKARLGRRWSKYVVMREDWSGACPDSFLVDTFQALLGAAVLQDLESVQAITDLICSGIGGDADFDRIAVIQDVANESLKSGGPLLQRLYQRFSGPPGPMIPLSKLMETAQQGPAHNPTISCIMKGDRTGELKGEGRTKASAIDEACRRTLLHVCRHVSSGTESRCRISWVEGIIRSLRDGLTETPNESVWLSIPHRNHLFPLPEVFHVVGDALRGVGNSSIDAALHKIENDVTVDAQQKVTLARLLPTLLAKRVSAKALEVVNQAYRSLLKMQDGGGSQQAVSLICSCLYLLRCLRGSEWETVCCHDLATDALMVLCAGTENLCSGPEGVVYIERERYRCVLKQLQSGTDRSASVMFAPSESGNVTLRIRGWRQTPGHEAVLEATWALCDAAGSGFFARRTAEGFEFQMPLVESVSVSPRGLSRIYIAGGKPKGIGTSRFARELEPQIEGVLSALHEIKNRMIAFPTGWREELRKYEGGLAEATNAMRSPQLARIDCEALHRIICEAAREADAGYGGACRCDVVYDEERAYCDQAMLATIFRNLASNASRAAREHGDGFWGIEGIVTGEEIDVTVLNTCKDVPTAKRIIESADGRSTSQLGTGVGLSTIRRLVAKLIGRLDFQYTADQVCARVFIPVDLTTAAGLLDDG